MLYIESSKTVVMPPYCVWVDNDYVKKPVAYFYDIEMAHRFVEEENKRKNVQK